MRQPILHNTCICAAVYNVALCGSLAFIYLFMFVFILEIKPTDNLNKII